MIEYEEIVLASPAECQVTPSAYILTPTLSMLAFVGLATWLSANGL
jgi:hypothetical protein